MPTADHSATEMMVVRHVTTPTIYDCRVLEPEGDPWRLHEALAGDVAAWTDLVDEFGDTIWHWARGQGLSRDDAEDVVQTVWYLLKDKGHGIHDPARLPGWLATTTRRTAQSLITSRHTRERVALTADLASVEVEADDPGIEDLAVSLDMETRLLAAFGSLRARCQELLALLWSDKLSYSEISTILDMPIGSIGPTRERCLNQLRRRAAL
jgi:RNA polymerase sigma factor (sigma-70 family)